LLDPETGRVVDCEDPDALAAVVISLLSDRERLTRMGAAARRWAVGSFDWQVLGQRAERLFGLEPVAAGSADSR
jgi:phosphatidylinositol alpha-1,6-mannosyltransferase